MPISKKYSFSLISFALLFVSIPFVLKIDEVAKMPFQYQLIACLALPLMILVVSVSYLTGQAKIDLEATFGAGRSTKERVLTPVNNGKPVEGD
jgi:hypothetical protein